MGQIQGSVQHPPESQRGRTPAQMPDRGCACVAQVAVLETERHLRAPCTVEQDIRARDRYLTFAAHAGI
jgi:hypothetical protein